MKDISDFNNILVAADTADAKINFIRKYFFHGIPFVFKGREQDYFEFRNTVASNFNISFHEVFIVGSGKFGFSYIKNTPFTYESDIDVVLVNESLFDYYYKKICDYQYQLDSQYKIISLDEKRDYANFLRYLIKGWMRPDLLPLSFQVDLLKKDWFNFFKSLSYGKSEVGNYKVAGGLYKNYDYLEKYYYINIESYYNNLKLG